MDKFLDRQSKKVMVKKVIIIMVLDVLMVVTGVLLGGRFGPCTIVTVIISGPIIQLVNDKSKQFFHL